MTHTHTNKRAEGSVRADRNFREGVSPSRIPGGAPPAAAVAGHCPQRRNPATPQPRAFTLVELLVVVSIIVILLGLVATMAPLDREQRRARESARAINAYLSSARNRAIETGRPCGVIFRNFGAGAAMNADQCEVPPSYAGESYDSVAQVIAIDPTTIQASLTTISNYGAPETIPIGMVKQGDLIQLNHQGPLYTIANDPSGGTVSVLMLALDPMHNANAFVPWSDSVPKAAPYRIFRAPIKGYAQPLQLPVPAVVDLTASGVGNVFPGPAADFTVLFSPNGSVECYYIGATRAIASGMIYLLVGSNERVANPYIPDNPNADTLTNFQDMNNSLWVTINTHTGAVQTEPVAAIPPNTTDRDEAVIYSRSEAQRAIGMGGN